MNMITRTLFFLLLPVVVSACPSIVSAQDSIRRNAIHYSAGVTIPTADFATNTFTYRAGFANPGVNMDLGIMHYGRRGIFGVYLNAGYTNIFFDRKSYLAEYVKIVGDEGITSVTTGNYQFLMADGGFLLRLFEILDTRIILHAGIGYTFCRHPYLSAENSYWGDLNTVNSDMDFQVFSTAGIGAVHHLDERTGISLSWSFKACKSSFRDTEGFMDHVYYVPVQMQNINIGITRYF